MEDMERLKAEWKLLQTLHHLFWNSRPPTFGTQNGLLQRDVLERLKNGITTLRTEIKLNIMNQNWYHDDLGGLLITSIEFKELMNSTGCLLNEFETWVDDGVLREVEIQLGEAEIASPMVGFLLHYKTSFCQLIGRLKIP